MIYPVQFLVAMIATVSFSVIFNAPKKDLIFCGMTGGIGWIIYYVMTKFWSGPVAACLVSTFVLTLVARFLAAKRRNPVTIYLLTGIFPLVPGAGIYYTAYYFFTAQKDLLASKGSETIEVAIAIVFGIIFGFALPQAIFNKITGNPGTSRKRE